MLISTQYYIHIKDSLPMDIDFTVQDSFALTRPQWKLAPNLEEAGRAFAESVKNNYKATESEKQAEPEELEEDSSEGDADEEDLPVPDMEDGQSSADEADTDVGPLRHCEPQR